MSKNYGYGIFVYRIYEGFHINLWECSMYDNYYVFLSGYLSENSQSAYYINGRKLYHG